MKKTFLFLLIIMTCRLCYSQKPTLTDTTYKSWTEVKNGKLSSDGKFAMYDISNLPLGRTTTVILSTDKKWEKRFIFLRDAQFSADSKYVFALLEGKLIKIILKTEQLQTIAHTGSFKLYKPQSTQYLIYLEDSTNTFKIHNLKSSEQQQYVGVQDYLVHKDLEMLVLKWKDSIGKIEGLRWLDPRNGKVEEIYKGSSTSDVIFSPSIAAIAFTTDQKNEKTIWYCRKGKAAIPLATGEETSKGFKIVTNEVWQFSKGGQNLYFTLSPTVPDYVIISGEPEVWSYQDKMIFPQFKKGGFNKLKWANRGRNLAVVNIETRVARKLLNDDQHIVGNVTQQVNNVFVVESLDTAAKEFIAMKNVRRSYFLLFADTKKMIPLEQHCLEEVTDFNFSPNNELLTYYSWQDENYHCYNLVTKQSNTFGEDIKSELYAYQDNIRKADKMQQKIHAWVADGSHVLISGTYDLWDIDVKNNVPPRRLTHSDDSNRTIFGFCKTAKNGVMNQMEDFYVYGQDFNTKMYGIYRLNLHKEKFSKLYSSDYLWNAPYIEIPDRFFQKSDDANAFLFMLPKVKESPNYFYTSDFKKIDTLSFNQPEKSYNWLSSELLHYKDKQGNDCQGVLYKPENFESQKKYPVVFEIYQGQARNLYQHLTPELVIAGLNIPVLVSQGYLVFKPDVYVSKNKIGEYALTSVLAGADYLSRMSWVDSSKMAITGHSLGGFEVEYIISHSDRFAAAHAFAGVSSMVNLYNDLWGFDKSEMNTFVTRSTPNMAGPLLENLTAYFENSPILNANDIKTPLLITHNELDLNVPFYQASQFFVQLRSLEKKVWLLSYEKEGHGLLQEKNKIDYQVKLRFFLDHYLKGAPMPDWMKKHISY